MLAVLGPAQAYEPVGSGGVAAWLRHPIFQRVGSIWNPGRGKSARNGCIYQAGATVTTTLPVTRAADLADVPMARRWLVELLWGDEAVGIVCGEPKCCKSFLALDLAVAVASGAPCMRRFPAASTAIASISTPAAASTTRSSTCGATRSPRSATTSGSTC